jgi:hypothetical protein
LQINVRDKYKLLTIFMQPRENKRKHQETIKQNGKYMTLCVCAPIKLYLQKKWWAGLAPRPADH